MIEFRLPAICLALLIFFQMREDCDQFRIANGTNPLLHHHKGHMSKNKDLYGKSTFELQKLFTFHKRKHEI